MKTEIRKEINSQKFDQLLLKEARVWDMAKSLLKRAWRSDNKFVVGFWLELIVIIILVVKK